jgi:hypothetical protein
LIASLFEKKQESLLNAQLDNDVSICLAKKSYSNIAKWFPVSQNYGSWSDENIFNSVIRKGCWPLSPYATWFIFFLTSAGKFLQNRSALALLERAFQNFSNRMVEDVSEWFISPVDLWSDELQEELINSEEGGQQGTITLFYSSAVSKYGAKLTEELLRILRAIVIASKIRLNVSDYNEAVSAICALSGLTEGVVSSSLRLLQDDYNIIVWDESFKTFDILGEAVPRAQFLSFLRNCVEKDYDETKRASLFLQKAAGFCELIKDLDSDFAEENNIGTIEWKFRHVISNENLLNVHLKDAAEKWNNAFHVDELRGTVIYVYARQTTDLSELSAQIKGNLNELAQKLNVEALPILTVILHDSEGKLGEYIATYEILDTMSESDKAKYKNLVGLHKEKLKKMAQELIEEQIRQRKYVTGIEEDFSSLRLSEAGTTLFKTIYKTPLEFPFDGFNTARGNAADTCQSFIYELMNGKLDHDVLKAKKIKDKNRGETVLNRTWKVFNSDGSISRKPGHLVVKQIIEEWDELLTGENGFLNIAQAIKKVCYPPFGLNTSSAGLLMGVYIAGRYDKLMVVKQSKKMNISVWLKSEEIFCRKFIDLGIIKDVNLVYIGDAASEWDNLLDEWEQCSDYLSHLDFSKKSKLLSENSPAPSNMSYRIDLLENRAQEARKKISDISLKIEEAKQKLAKAHEYEDCSNASFAAFKLKKTIEELELDSNWTEQNVKKVSDLYGKARQYSIQYFPLWLEQQTLWSDKPEEVGDFKHKMLNNIGKNLKAIGMEEEYKKLVEHTENTVRNAEEKIKLNQLNRNVDDWLSECNRKINVLTIVEIRAQKQIGIDYLKSMVELVRKNESSQTLEIKRSLSEAIEKLKKRDDHFFQLSSELQTAQINTEADIEKINSEIGPLIQAFDGTQTTDKEELQIMRKALRMYQDAYEKLSDKNLPWDVFEKIAKEEKEKCEKELYEDEPPWNSSDVIDNFVKRISQNREELSLSWIEAMEKSVKSMDDLGSMNIGSLRDRLLNPPAVLTDEHAQKAAKFIQIVDEYLSKKGNSEKIKIMMDIFQKLTNEAKKEFYQRIKAEVEGNGQLIS